VTGRVAVLDRADVDTDQIIPKQLNAGETVFPPRAPFFMSLVSDGRGDSHWTRSSRPHLGGGPGRARTSVEHPRGGSTP